MASNNNGKIIGLVLSIAISILLIAIFSAILGAKPISISSTIQPVNIDIAHLVRMSLIQAFLSTLFSVLAGILIAYSLNRLEFFGRKIIIAIFASAIIAPGLVIAIGLLAVWGREGIIANLAQILGLNWEFSIFGLKGILFAHIILNGAFAGTIFLARLDNIAIHKLKIAQSLNLSPLKRFMVLDWPTIKAALPHVSAIIFLLCFTSFPIVLLLGGGPANQTLEVAIYSAVRLDFNLKLAAQIALIQLIICIFIILPSLFSKQVNLRAGISRPYDWKENKYIRLFQFIILFLFFFAFILPIIAVLINLFSTEIFTILQKQNFWRATFTSLILGSLSAILTTLIAIFIVKAKIGIKNKYMGAIISLPLYAYLVVPAVVLSLGFYILSLHLRISSTIIAPFVLIIANSLLALPFAVSLLLPSLTAINLRYNKLSRSLNLSEFKRWHLVEWPLLGRDIGIILGLGFGFSLGDLGVISLFGTNEFMTLPWSMFLASGAYRTNESAIIGAIILLLIFSIFWFLPIIFRKWANAKS